ncbi:MAG: hypothetical protein R6W66_10760, partial [Pelovirga sp.]
SKNRSQVDLSAIGHLPAAERSTWERFFDAHAPIYERNVFTRNTVREVDFLLEELELPAAKCKYALWNPPCEEPCPKCGWALTEIKTTKRFGTVQRCPQTECDWEKVITPPEKKTPAAKTPVKQPAAKKPAAKKPAAKKTAAKKTTSKKPAATTGDSVKQ